MLSELIASGADAPSSPLETACIAAFKAVEKTFVKKIDKIERRRMGGGAWRWLGKCAGGMNGDGAATSASSSRSEPSGGTTACVVLVQRRRHRRGGGGGGGGGGGAEVHLLGDGQTGGGDWEEAVDVVAANAGDSGALLIPLASVAATYLLSVGFVTQALTQPRDVSAEIALWK